MIWETSNESLAEVWELLGIPRREGAHMKYFRLKYADGRVETVKADNALALIRERELYTREHISTRIVELAGEQEAIARSNDQD